MYRLNDRIALITGGGSGLGKAMSLLFAEEGADIAIADIDSSSAEKTAREVREIGRRAIAIRADIAESKDVDMMTDSVLSNLGDIHILVNNAGIVGEIVPTIESSIEIWDKVTRVHLRGTYLCCRQVGNWMVSRKAGKILNMGSVAGIGGMPMRADYGPAKAGIIYMTRALAVEWAKYNINVNCLAPGYIMTPMAAKLIKEGKINEEPINKRTPLGRMGRPDDVAKAALFLVSDDANYITGVTLPVDGGWLAYSYL